DGHEVHLYASGWDAAALPATTIYHRLPVPRGPRFLRPWRFSASCLRELAKAAHHVSLGFDKTWGQDVLYPQGGLHAASTDHTLRKYRSPWSCRLARLAKGLDLAHWSYSRLERRQYCGKGRPLIVVNSNMVLRHFQHYYGIPAEEVRVIPSAIDADRFIEQDRP